VLVWNDGKGNWGVGDWQRLSRSDAVIQADVDYFQGRPATPSFVAALQQLLQSKPPPDEA
jgi:hypothetical protein